MRTVFRAHSAGGDACSFACGAGFGIAAVADVAYAAALASAVRAPVGILYLSFHGRGSEFVPVAGMIAVDRTGSGFITGAVTFIAMLFTCSVTAFAVNRLLCLVKKLLAGSAALGAERSA